MTLQIFPLHDAMSLHAGPDFLKIQMAMWVFRVFRKNMIQE